MLASLDLERLGIEDIAGSYALAGSLIGEGRADALAGRADGAMTRVSPLPDRREGCARA